MITDEGVSMSPTVTVFIATSVDGFIARKDGNLDWLDHDRGGEDYGYIDFYRNTDVLVMGRLTYEKVATYKDWPYRGKEVVVLSSTLTMEDIPENLRDEVSVSSLDPRDLIEKLLNDGKYNIYVDGGKTIMSFFKAGLITDLVISRMPVLLGEGIPLFGHLDNDIKLNLLTSRSYSSGLVQTMYKVVY